MAWENPLYGAGAMENPLSGGELALGLVTGGLGYVLTDVLDRFMATKKDDPNNAALILSTPSVGRMAAQAGLTALPFAAAYFVKQPMGRAALQGFGLGAGIHLVGQLVRTFVLGKMLKDKDYGKQLYPDVIVAEATTAQIPPASTVPSGTVTGLPFGVGTTPRGLVTQYREVGPYAGRPVGVGMNLMQSQVKRDTGISHTGALVQTGTTNTGAPVYTAVSNGGGGAPVMTATTNSDGAPVAVYGNVPTSMPTPNYPPGDNTYVSNGAGCLPCSAESSRAAAIGAYQAARDEVGGCGNGMMGAPPVFTTKASASFPD